MYVRVCMYVYVCMCVCVYVCLFGCVMVSIKRQEGVYVSVGSVIIKQTNKQTN